LSLRNSRTAVGLVALLMSCALPLAAQAPLAGQGRIVSLTGSLSVKRAGVPTRAVALYDTVDTGDELITDARSEATIQTTDGSTIHVYPDSRVVFSQQSVGLGEFLHLFFGSIKVHIERLGGRPNPHSMTTPTAVIAVRGTTFSFFVDDMDPAWIIALRQRSTPWFRRSDSTQAT